MSPGRWEPEGAREAAPAGARRLPGLPPPRLILVDAFNVLHVALLGEDRGEGWWRRTNRERLLDLVAGWRGGPDEIWVAFDGPRPSLEVRGELAGPGISFGQDDPGQDDPGQDDPGQDDPGSEDSVQPSGRGRGPTIVSLFVESADDWIVRRARRASQPDRVVVVSADRKVAGRARSAGCEVMPPWRFVAGCRPPEPGPTDPE